MYLKKHLSTYIDNHNSKKKTRLSNSEHFPKSGKRSAAFEKNVKILQEFSSNLYTV